MRVPFDSSGQLQPDDVHGQAAESNEAATKQEETRSGASISQIGHLFLSGLREKQAPPSQRPVRIGPPKLAPSVEQMGAGKAERIGDVAQPIRIAVQGGTDRVAEAAVASAGGPSPTLDAAEDKTASWRSLPPKRQQSGEALVGIEAKEAAVLSAAALNGGALSGGALKGGAGGGGQDTLEFVVTTADVVGLRLTRDYVRHLASKSGRVGVVTLGRDCVDFAVVDRSKKSDGGRLPECTSLEAAIDLMRCTVRKWVIVGTLDQLACLKEIRRSVFVDHAVAGVISDKCFGFGVCASGDEASMVSAYKALKAMHAAQIKPACVMVRVPDAADVQQCETVAKRLNAVAMRFLEISAPEVRGFTHVETPWQDIWSGRADADGVMLRLPEAGKPRVLSGGLGMQAMLSKLILALPKPMAREAEMGTEGQDTTVHDPLMAVAREMEDSAIEDDVLSLEADEPLAHALIHSGKHALSACEVDVPQMSSARLAVDHAGRLVLVASSEESLSGLSDVAQAYKWVCDTRQLLSMALPGAGIDSAAQPRLMLMVKREGSESASSAADLRPLLARANVMVIPYRTLRWGGRWGMILAA